MIRGRKWLLIGAFAATVMFGVGVSVAMAEDSIDTPHATHEVLHRDCSWSVNKQVFNPQTLTWVDGLTVNLAVDQQFSKQYKITVSATCVDSHDVIDDVDGHVVSNHAPDGDHAGTTPDPDHSTHLCISVDDDHFSPVFGDNQVCQNELDHGSLSFLYVRHLGPFHGCGDFDETNTVILDDLHGNQLVDSHGNPIQDSVTVHVHIPCNVGCTLTQGYWKTHSAQGPAPFDDNWNNVPNVYPGAPSGLAENTPFYFSGQTWYQVFWTPSAGGNAYYILAKQYMAAILNILNGASAPAAVNTALANATTYFNNAANTPASALNLSKSARNTLLGYATTLGNYNSGLTGPGHCDEDSDTNHSTD